jgi:long-chain fatty acid transport protein
MRRLRSIGRLGAAVGLLFGALTGSSARADDLRYNDYPIGNRAVGLAGAFTAIANDPSGLYYNPAGLVGTTRTNVSVSTSLYGLESTSPKGLADVDLWNLQFNIIPSEVGGSYAIGDLKPGERAKGAWGFEVVVPSSRAISYARREELSDGFRDDTRTLQDQTLWAGVGGAFSVNEKLSLGASIFVRHRTVLMNERTTGKSSEGGFLDEMTSLDAYDDSCVSILGAHYQLDSHWSFGAMFMSPSVHLRSGGRARVTKVQWGGVGNNEPSEKEFVADTRVNRNAMRLDTHSNGGFRLGASYQHSHRFTISFDLSGHFPTSYDRVKFQDDSIADAITLPTKVRRDMTVNGALGGEWNFHSKWSVAGGLFTDFSSAPDLSADSSGRLLSGGRDALSQVNLYGGTIAVGYFGDHSLSRVGFSGVTGWGKDVRFEARDNGWMVFPTRETLAYVFIASTFRY